MIYDICMYIQGHDNMTYDKPESKFSMKSRSISDILASSFSNLYNCSPPSPPVFVNLSQNQNYY